MPFQLPVIGAYAAGIVLLLVIALLLVVPLKMVLRLVYNGLIGGLALWLLNLIGTPFGLALPITVWTALVAGFFGIPGVLLMLVYYYAVAGKVI